MTPFTLHTKNIIDIFEKVDDLLLFAGNATIFINLCMLLICRVLIAKRGYKSSSKENMNENVAITIEIELVVSLLTILDGSIINIKISENGIFDNRKYGSPMKLCIHDAIARGTHVYHLIGWQGDTITFWFFCQDIFEKIIFFFYVPFPINLMPHNIITIFIEIGSRVSNPHLWMRIERIATQTIFMEKGIKNKTYQ